MKACKTKWLYCSLKKKIVIIMILLMLFTVFSESKIIFVWKWTLDNFENIMNSN